MFAVWLSQSYVDTLALYISCLVWLQIASRPENAGKLVTVVLPRLLTGLL